MGQGKASQRPGHFSWLLENEAKPTRGKAAQGQEPECERHGKTGGP